MSGELDDYGNLLSDSLAQADLTNLTNQTNADNLANANSLIDQGYTDYGSNTGFGSAGTSYLSDVNLESQLSKYAKNLYTDKNGNIDFAKVATLLGGAVAAFNPNQGNKGGSGAGYQGGIPTLYAGRTMLTAPPTSINGIARRPGSGGINYGGNVTYFNTQKEVDAQKAEADARAAALAALNTANTTNTTNTNANTNTVNTNTNTNTNTNNNNNDNSSNVTSSVDTNKNVVNTNSLTAQYLGSNKPVDATGLTPQIANFLMYKSMSGGATTADFNKYGGYEKVASLAEDNGMEYSAKWIADYEKAAKLAATRDASGASLASGGLAGAAKGRYLQGHTDGMADEIPAQIGENQPAALSHGEFVIPADVVSHLGNGNSDAGAKKLYQMMDKIRMARTGNKQQGKKINPDKFMPGGLAAAYAAGGAVKHFEAGGPTTSSLVNAGFTGTESNLSNWAGPYVTNMLGQGQALANMPYQAYTGPLTAGESALQSKVSKGLGDIAFPTNLGQSFSSSGAYQLPSLSTNAYDAAPIGQGAGAASSGVTSANTAPQGIAAQYMNPYLESVLTPQLAELRRQSQINLQPSLAKLTQAGGFGGSRQAIMESEANRNLLQAQNQAIGQGYASAFDKAMGQFNTEQGQAKTLADMMAGAGAAQRGIEQEGITADYNEFLAQRDYPMKQTQYLQSMLQGLPISTVTNTPAQMSGIGQLTSTIGGLGSLLETIKGLKLG